MSHLKERKERICLNCQAELYGRYCHQCGQENLEPKETVGHLVLHFFNDITHFDGKFFSTVKYLLRKPGFLSLEYMNGRRAAYLNPVRTYVFTSAFFFLILFSMKGVKESIVQVNEKPDKPQYMGLRELEKQKALLEDQLGRGRDGNDRGENREEISQVGTEMAFIRQTYGDTSTRKFDQKERMQMWLTALGDSLKQTLQPAARDSVTRMIRDEKENAEGGNLLGLHEGRYKGLSFYDSVQKSLPEPQRDGWFKEKLMRKLLKTEEEIDRDKTGYIEHFEENFLHSFPKILFFSLPFFALILRLVYIRRKQYYYVDHGIFAIHVYCAFFILLLILLLLGNLHDLLSWNWMAVPFRIADSLVVLYMVIYLYLAMRGFYKQGRGKTFLKYLLVGLMAVIVDGLLALLFGIISALFV